MPQFITAVSSEVSFYIHVRSSWKSLEFWPLKIKAGFMTDNNKKGKKSWEFSEDHRRQELVLTEKEEIKRPGHDFSLGNDFSLFSG